MKIQSAKIKYEKNVVDVMKKKFGFSNSLAVPKIEKVVLNVGTGKISKEIEKVSEVAEFIAAVSGQKSVETKAKKAISGFKSRQGMGVGLRVTLRGKRMWHFIDRLVNAAIPRTRDFQGIKPSSVDANGNLNLGIKEHIIFPEIFPEKVKNIFSLQVNVSTTAKNQEQGMELFKLLGFPIK